MNETYLHHTESILRVLVFIESHLSEELNLDKLAKIAHISPYYFHRLFHAYMGETLSDYVTRLRVQRASEKLNYTDSTVTDIALDVGYETPSSFTKVFNQVMGSSPSAFRKSMRPALDLILKRISPSLAQEPKYVERKEEKVLFIRKIGSYEETPWQGFQQLLQFLTQENLSIKTFYSMGLDDPNIVPKEKCRFDACVALKNECTPKGDVGIKILPAGRYAVFVHKGSYAEIETFFQKIFATWYPSANISLSDAPPFCEHLELGDENIPMTERTTHLYIPLVK